MNGGPTRPNAKSNTCDSSAEIVGKLRSPAIGLKSSMFLEIGRKLVS